MKRSVLVGILLASNYALPAAAEQDIDLHIRGYAQLTAEHVNGVDDTVSFGAERARPRIAVDAGRWSAAMQLDFAVDDLGDHRPGALANVIMDLYVSYRLSDKYSFRFGQYKTPLGLDFNMPAHQLDITKRGMEAGLILNRAFGAMLTGNQILPGLSYDIGLFNSPGRSKATDYVDSQVGQDLGKVARLRYDNSNWHAELSHGIADEAGGPGSNDYAVSDLALRFAPERWTIKAEWIQGCDVLGLAGRKETVGYLHIAYDLTPGLELVARHYAGRSRIDSVTTGLDNTYFGITKHFATQSRLQARLQANYVIASGDRAAYSGLRGYRDDALLLQLQLYLDNQ